MSYARSCGSSAANLLALNEDKAAVDGGIESAARTARSADGLPSRAGGSFHATPAADPVDSFCYRFNFGRSSMV